MKGGRLGSAACCPCGERGKGRKARLLAAGDFVVDAQGQQALTETGGVSLELPWVGREEAGGLLARKEGQAEVQGCARVLQGSQCTGVQRREEGREGCPGIAAIEKRALQSSARIRKGYIIG